MNNTIFEIQDWLKTVTFKEFHSKIKERVIGQDNLNLILANIYSYLNNAANGLPINHNMLLTSPSGSGKTETYRAIKDYFNKTIPSLPVYIKDLSSITPSGFKGSEPKHLVLPLINTGVKDPIAIVFLDEFDKKILPSMNSKREDVNMEVQYQLLTILEGGDVVFENMRNNLGMAASVNTKNIMFIGLGSFDYCRKMKEEGTKAIGFNNEDEDFDHYNDIKREDIINVGGSYELIGRFPLIVNYQKLDYEAIDLIINKYIKELKKTYNCDIEVSESLISELHKQANGNFGCRLLNSTLSEHLLKPYAKALSEEKTEDKKIVLSLSLDENSYYYRDLTKEEIDRQKFLDDINNSIIIPSIFTERI